ncbi:MAG: hypothetical protein ACRC3A_08780 [Culicoidibacterales bacterium]
MNQENTLAEEVLALTKRVEQLEAHYQKIGTIKEEQRIVSNEKEAELEKQQAKIDELEVSNQMNQQERNQLEATVQKQAKLIYELQPSIESLIEQDADQIKNSLAKVSFEQIIETAKNEFGIFELQTFENEFAKVCQLITNKIKQL